MPSFSRPVALLFAFSPMLAACEPISECTETLELIDFKADTVFGMTASEALTGLGLPFEGPMGYTNESPAGEELRGAMTQAAIAVAYAEGEVRYFDLEVNPDFRDRGFGTSDADFGETCPDRVEVDLSTTFTTADGRFAEQAVGGVMTIRRDPWADEPGVDDISVEFSAELPIDALQGSFTPDLVEDELSRLTLTWSPPSAEGEGSQAGSGSLNAEIYAGEGDEGWVSFGALAWIGTDPAENGN